MRLQHGFKCFRNEITIQIENYNIVLYRRDISTRFIQRLQRLESHKHFTVARNSVNALASDLAFHRHGSPDHFFGIILRPGLYCYPSIFIQNRVISETLHNTAVTIQSDTSCLFRPLRISHSYIYIVTSVTLSKLQLDASCTEKVIVLPVATSYINHVPVLTKFCAKSTFGIS